MEQEDWEKVVDFADVKGQKELIDAVIVFPHPGSPIISILCPDRKSTRLNSSH